VEHEIKVQLIHADGDLGQAHITEGSDARGSVIKRDVQTSARRFRRNVFVDGYTSDGVRS
jgi:ribosomal protein S6E (S10)